MAMSLSKIDKELFIACPDDSIDYAVNGKKRPMQLLSVWMLNGVMLVPGPHFGK